MHSTPSQPVRSEINVTPLVDVCLVLLIIFMVVTPMVGNGGLVNLPQTASPQRVAEAKAQLTVSIDAAGRLYVDEQLVGTDRLPQLLAERHALDPRLELRLRADRSLSYAQVRDVMRSVSEVGFTKAGILTVKKERPGLHQS